MNKPLLEQLKDFHQIFSTLLCAKPFIRKLKSNGGQRGLQLAKAVENYLEADQQFVPEIEKERTRMLADDSLLSSQPVTGLGIYDLEDETVRGVCLVSKPANQAYFLKRLVESLMPRTTIELGTNVGISSAYILSGLKNQEGTASFITMESSPKRLCLAKDLHSRLGFRSTFYVQGLFAETLEDTLLELGEVDLAFIDGHHQYEPTLDYFESIYKY